MPTPEETQFDPTQLFQQYGGQHANQEYIAAVEAAGYEPQLISGKVPTTQFGGTVLADVTHGGSPEGIYQLRTGELEQKSFAERSALPATGPATQRYSYWDERGVTVHAPAGYHFETYANGAVKAVQGLIAKGTTEANAASPTRTSLFDQPEKLQAPGTYAGKEFKQETLGYEPIAGKTIKTTGQTVFNEKTGVDEHAGPGETLILYEDGTVERRKQGGAPGTAVPTGEFGRTPEELGITRQTEIKNAEGGIARAPITESVAQMQARGASAEEIEQRIAAEGTLAATSDLTFIGTEANGKTAKEGNAFYRAPDGKLLERPISLQKFAKQPASDEVPTLADDLLSAYGLAADQQAFVTNPVSSVESLFTRALEQFGAGDARSAKTYYDGELADLDAQYADEIFEINSNPWLSEGIRTKQIAAVQEKYDTKRAQLVSRAQLALAFDDQATQKAQWLTGQVLQQYNQDRSFALDQAQLVMQRADQMFDQKLKLASLEMDRESLKRQAEEFELSLTEERRQFDAEFGLSAQRENRLGTGRTSSGTSGGTAQPKLLSKAEFITREENTRLQTLSPAMRDQLYNEYVEANNMTTDEAALISQAMGVISEEQRRLLDLLGTKEAKQQLILIGQQVASGSYVPARSSSGRTP